MSFTQRSRDDEGTKGGGNASGIRKERNYRGIMRAD